MPVPPTAHPQSSFSSRWDSEVTPGTDTERALVSAGAQHGLGGSWRGELASPLGCRSHSLPRYSVSALILPRTVPHLPRSEKGARGSDFQESWALCHGDTIPTPAPTDARPLGGDPAPRAGTCAHGRDLVTGRKPHLCSGNPDLGVTPVPWATKHTNQYFDILICPQKQHQSTSHC